MNNHIICISLCIGDYKYNPNPLSIMFNDLRELQIIRISQNISEISKSIGKCTNLRILDLQNNKLTSLPAEIGHCTHLEGINLRGVGLTALPDEFGNLAHLRQLDCARNHLHDLPPSFGQLHALEYVDFSFNQFFEIPRSIGHLTAAKQINFKDNQITFIPPEILTHLSHLEKLGIFGNPLRSLYGIAALGERVSGWQSVLPYVQLTPHGMDLLKKWDIPAIEAYYAKSVGELALTFIHTGQLSQEEMERLIHEATLDERSILEQHIPPDHPILQQLNARLRISHSSGEEILL